eukprot:2025985-Karenia_brevis.AAC.1
MAGLGTIVNFNMGSGHQNSVQSPKWNLGIQLNLRASGFVMDISAHNCSLRIRKHTSIDEQSVGGRTKSPPPNQQRTARHTSCKLEGFH